MSRAGTISLTEGGGQMAYNSKMLAGRMHSVQAKFRLMRMKRNYHGIEG